MTQQEPSLEEGSVVGAFGKSMALEQCSGDWRRE